MNDQIQIQPKGNMVVVPKDHRQRVHMFSPFLEGHRRWLSDGSFQFELTPHNKKKALEARIEVLEPEKGDDGSVWDLKRPRPAFSSPLVNLEHQDRADEQFSDQMLCAYFAEMGTGKTKMAIDKVNKEWCKGTIDVVIVLAKKGVHIQWAEGEPDEDGNQKQSPIDALTQKDIDRRMWAWKGKPIPDELLTQFDGITWFTFNFDAIIHKKAAEQLERILELFSGRIALVGDETHYWKSYRASRTKAAIKVSDHCPLRIIMTGTPLAKNLEDEWSQFKVLDEGILGHRYVTTFRNEFCVMGGFEGREVVGSRNLDRFKELTAPHVFRVKKSECLDLPEKQYRQVKFSMSKEQQQAIAQLKQTQTFTLEDGTDVFFEGAAPVLGKIQEVSNGFLVHPGGIVHFPNPRLTALQEFLEDTEEKAILWCRYKQDVYNLMEAFDGEALDYFGETKDCDREAHKAAFINDPSKRYLIATTGAMAEGVDGLQKVCSLACYYSNNFNSIQRWQSEDRIHRIGMGDKALYADFLARGCIDYNVLRNLQSKADFSYLVLDVGREFGLSVENRQQGHRKTHVKDFDGQTPIEEDNCPSSTNFEKSKIDWEF